MYYSVIKKFLKKTNLTQNYMAYITSKLANEQLLCVCYDGKTKPEIYYVGNNEVKKYNGTKFIKDKDEIAEYLLAKKITNFYSESNYAIGRKRTKKDDFAVFNLTESVINYKNIISFKNEDIKTYLENKLKRFSIDFIKNKEFNIKGDKKDFLTLAENKIRNIKRSQHFGIFADVFTNSVKNKGILKEIAKKITDKDFLFNEERLKRFNADKFLATTRVIFINRNIPVKANIKNFNDFFFMVSKEIIVKNKKFYYPLKIGDKLREKPLISKINNVYEPEENMFKIYFFMKYVLKTSRKKDKSEVLNKQGLMDEPVYNFQNQELAVSSFDVLTNRERKINPVFILYNLDNIFLKNKDNITEKISDFYVFADRVKQILKITNKTKKEYFLNVDIRDLGNRNFVDEKELNGAFKNFLKEIVNYENLLLIDVLKQNAEKELNSNFAKYRIFERLSMLISIKSYLKGVKMQETKSKLFYLRSNFEEMIKKLKNKEEIKSAEDDLLSYVAGNTIKYFINKRQGEKKVSLIIPIFENTRNFKDVKNELDKVFVSYGYDESFNSSALKVLSLIKGINDSVKVNKDYFLIGLLDNIDAFYIKSEKGDNNE